MVYYLINLKYFAIEAQLRKDLTLEFAMKKTCWFFFRGFQILSWQFSNRQLSNLLTFPFTAFTGTGTISREQGTMGRRMDGHSRWPCWDAEELLEMHTQTWEVNLHGQAPTCPHGPNHQEEVSQHMSEALGLLASPKPFFLLVFVPLSPLLLRSHFQSTDRWRASKTFHGRGWRRLSLPLSHRLAFKQLN